MVSSKAFVQPTAHPPSILYLPATESRIQFLTQVLFWAGEYVVKRLIVVLASGNTQSCWGTNKYKENHNTVP